MSERVYSYDEVFAAICIMEEIADTNLPDAPAPWDAHREMWGINGLRDHIINKLAGACDQAWTKARDRYDVAYTAWSAKHPDDPAKGEEPDDIGCFDYEFVPVWIRECVDWSDVSSGPRVRGT